MARRRKGRSINGILLIDKHSGESSNNIVQQVKRLYGAAKAGHTGALDPLATGMLPVCLGEATKFSQFLLDADKTYEVIAKLGERTDTSDADGEIVETRENTASKKDIEQALTHFRGDIKQIPSMFSALKHEGKPLYHYARQGINIAREARPISVYSNEILDYRDNLLSLRIHCSKGTYIRTIVDDLGQMLGCGAHVKALRRTSVADFPHQMHSVQYYQKSVELLENTAQQHAKLDACLLDMDLPVLSLHKAQLNERDTIQFQRGHDIAFSSCELGHTPQLDEMLRIYSNNGLFLGVAYATAKQSLQPKRLVVYEQA